MKSLLCPICINDAPYSFTSKHGKEVYSCPNDLCQHIFTKPLSHTQGICERDENILEESDRFLEIYGDRNKQLCELFFSFFPFHRQLIFLDYGSGNAHISRTIKEEKKELILIYCLEINDKCKVIYDKYHLNYIESIRKLPSGIKPDLCYLVEVIEHLVDPISALQEIKSCLPDGGKIFITTPLGCLDEGSTNAFETPSHLHFFTKRSLSLCLRKAGFHNIRFEYFPELYPRKIISNPIISTIRDLLITTKKFYINRITHNYQIKHLTCLITK